MAKDSGIIFSIYIEMIFQYHLILCQCPCLVCAEDVHSTKILNGIEVFYNGLFFTHGNSAFCKTGGYNHRKHFRCESHCNGNPK